jgi:hypothetical protein
MPKTGTTTNDQIAVLTRAEIDRMRTGFTARRAAITEQLAEIEAHRRVGQTASMLADVVKARNLAREMLNGHGAALIPAASDEPLESRFYTERNAIDICLKALRNSELPLRAAEAVRWREEHSAEWNRLMKVALITRDARGGTQACYRSASLHNDWHAPQPKSSDRVRQGRERSSRAAHNYTARSYRRKVDGE